MNNVTVRMSSKRFTVLKYLALIANTYIVGVSFVSSNFGFVHKVISGVIFSALLVNTVVMTGYVQWRMKNHWSETHTFDDI